MTGRLCRIELPIASGQECPTRQTEGGASKPKGKGKPGNNSRETGTATSTTTQKEQPEILQQVVWARW